MKLLDLNDLNQIHLVKKQNKKTKPLFFYLAVLEIAKKTNNSKFQKVNTFVVFNSAPVFTFWIFEVVSRPINL